MSFILSIFAIMLIPFAAAGLGLIHAGLGRSRSAAHALLATLCVLSVAAIVFVVVGFTFTGFPAARPTPSPPVEQTGTGLALKSFSPAASRLTALASTPASHSSSVSTSLP